MTRRQLQRLCPILLAIMLTGIVESGTCAQARGQAGKAKRAATTLVPPTGQPQSKPETKPETKPDTKPAGESQPQTAPSIRIALEMAPPALKSTGPKRAQRRAAELNAPQVTSSAKTAAALDPPPSKPFPGRAVSHQRLPAAPSAPSQSGPVQSGPTLSGPAPSRPIPSESPFDTAGSTQTLLSIDPPQSRVAEKLRASEHAGPADLAPPSAASQDAAAQSPNVAEKSPRIAQALPAHAQSNALPLDDVPNLAPPQAPPVEPELVEPALIAPAPVEPALVEPAPVEPALVEPYWVSEVLRLSASDKPNLQPLDFDQAIWDALAHSPYVKAVLTVPMISQAKISEASGIFDQTPFVDSIFNDTSDPVGSTLTTGGPSRLNEMRLDNAVGVRTKNRLGGSAELAQNLQLRNNNSVFLAPKDQADAKLLLRLNQPLMRGAGRTYTTSSLRIAEFNAGVTEHEAMRKLQLHAEAIAGAYWNLFAARAIELQAQRGIERLAYLRDELLKRSELDGLRSQLLRAEAAIARQNATKARAQADVASAEASLRALVNSPALAGGPAMLMPATPPIDQPFHVDRTSELQAALACHPDLLAARDRIKAATTRLKVAENELRPTLNLVMEGYLHGLNGDYGLGDSMADQFSRGRPSYAGGLNYQRPYRNIVSKAILRERRLELRQLLLDLDNMLLTVTAEVEQAIEAVNYTYAELEASVQSTMAFDAEVRYLNGRWQNAFVETTQPSLLLDELLNAQTQLIQAENSWARAQAEHMIAFARLHVATGMLLNSIPIPVDE